jgi:hypothetical protein
MINSFIVNNIRSVQEQISNERLIDRNISLQVCDSFVINPLPIDSRFTVENIIQQSNPLRMKFNSLYENFDIEKSTMCYDFNMDTKLKNVGAENNNYEYNYSENNPIIENKNKYNFNENNNYLNTSGKYLFEDGIRPTKTQHKYISSDKLLFNNDTRQNRINQI